MFSTADFAGEIWLVGMVFKPLSRFRGLSCDTVLEAVSHVDLQEEPLVVAPVGSHLFFLHVDMCFD